MSTSLEEAGDSNPDSKQLTAAELTQATVCANCSAPLQGPICHECGQKANSPLRHVGALIEDMADSFFDFDNRLLRTLPALYFRPGFLTREYFAGRRIRYLPPFRLTFLLSVLAFFVIQFAVDGSGVNIGPPSVRGNAFSAATTPAEVSQLLDKQLANLQQARQQVGSIAAAGIDKADAELRRQADARIAALTNQGENKPETAMPEALSAWPARIAGAGSLADLQSLTRQANAAIDQQRQSKSTTVSRNTELDALEENVYQAAGQRVAALAASADAQEPQVDVNVPDGGLLGSFGQRYAQRVKHNVKQFSSDPQTRQRLAATTFNISPAVLLAMLPVFAVLLKIMYLFKRRLYVEHLMVALHSHAFIFLSLLLVALANLARSALPSTATWIQAPLLWLMWGLVAWVPLYLLMMQKRIYQQGWAMTLAKYALLGMAYWMLLSFAVAAILAITLGSI